MQSKKWRGRTIEQIADMICGNFPKDESYFPYRSSHYLTQFFEDAGTDFRHDGTTRHRWVGGVLSEILQEGTPDMQNLPDAFCRVIRRLMEQDEANNEDFSRKNALEMLNASLSREGFEAYYAEDKQCYLRHIASNKTLLPGLNPHRPFTKAEQERREQLKAHLTRISEDQLIEEVLLPLFRQLRFYRISAAGHKDKALEYGKDIWMKYTLPTQHVLYFGIQVKKDKLDAAGSGRAGNVNVAEIHNQVNMMLGHEIFDPELNRRVLVDHAFIVAGGEITKAARNWLGERLDQTKRSQIMFMDQADILNLYIVTNLPLPDGAVLPGLSSMDDDIPF